MKALLGLTLIIACTVAPPQPPEPATLPSWRVESIKRNVAWAFDSVPLLRFQPPFVYGAVRLQVERCSGLTREGWPTFYVASVNPMPGGVLAFYNEDLNAIVFGLGQEVVLPTVGHELLHFLLAPHIPSKKHSDETHEEYVARVHPDSVFGPRGKCAEYLSPGR